MPTKYSLFAAVVLIGTSLFFGLLGKSLEREAFAYTESQATHDPVVFSFEGLGASAKIFDAGVFPLRSLLDLNEDFFGHQIREVRIEAKIPASGPPTVDANLLVNDEVFSNSVRIFKGGVGFQTFVFPLLLPSPSNPGLKVPTDRNALGFEVRTLKLSLNGRVKLNRIIVEFVPPRDGNLKFQEATVNLSNPGSKPEIIDLTNLVTNPNWVARKLRRVILRVAGAQGVDLQLFSRMGERGEFRPAGPRQRVPGGTGEVLVELPLHWYQSIHGIDFDQIQLRVSNIFRRGQIVAFGGRYSWNSYHVKDMPDHGIPRNHFGDLFLKNLGLAKEIADLKSIGHDPLVEAIIVKAQLTRPRPNGSVTLHLNKGRNERAISQVKGTEGNPSLFVFQVPNDFQPPYSQHLIRFLGDFNIHSIRALIRLK